MSRATRLLIIYHLCRLREEAMGELVEVRRNAGQHTHNPRAIKRHELGLFLARGAQMHHDVIRMLQPLQPRNAPAEDLRLVGHARLARGCWVGQRALGLPRRGGVLLAEPTEPHRDLMRVVCLKQLRNPGRTDVGSPCDLPDGQAGLLGRHDGPDPFPLGVGQPRHGEAESGDQLLLVTDTLLQGFRGFHVQQDSRFSLCCTEN